MNHQLDCKFHNIEMERGLLRHGHAIAHYLIGLNTAIAIITDEAIGKLYGESLMHLLEGYGRDIYLFTFPSGEQHKTRQTKEILENKMFEKGLGRDTCLVALGGGVVSDLAGFIAATFCRGIPWVIIPTTLLSMVDACIGGKTGVDVPYGKNLVGAIYQPKRVYIDPETLSMLPTNELRNGVVEMIKHGLIADFAYFDYLENNVNALLSQDPLVMDKAIDESCKIKIGIIERDEKEDGMRRLLNYGHTVGHALEKLSNYSMAHGEAVAIGIVVESYLSMQLGHLEFNSVQRIKDLLTHYGLPFYLPACFTLQEIKDAMKLDKKTVKGMPRFVQLEKIGTPLVFAGVYCTEVKEDLIDEALNWMIHDLCSY